MDALNDNVVGGETGTSMSPLSSHTRLSTTVRLFSDRSTALTSDDHRAGLPASAGCGRA